MTSRVWKYLGCDNFGRMAIAYRIDGEPLCVDCERDLVTEITNFLATATEPPPRIYQTVRLYEGKVITWSIGDASEPTVPMDLLPVLQAGNCFPTHLTRQ